MTAKEAGIRDRRDADTESGPSSSDAAAWLCNSDVEAEWARSEHEGRPREGERAAIFLRFEEILLASLQPPDVAVLRAPPDPLFLAYLQALGLSLPEVLVVAGADRAPRASTARLLLDDAASLEDLTRRARSGANVRLEPFGASDDIEQIASRTGLRLTGSDARTAAVVSRKSSARRLAAQLGLPLPEGDVCEDPEDLPGLVRTLRRAGEGCPVVIKPEWGASGRGQRLVRSDADLERFAADIAAGKLGAAGTTHVVERWYPARATLTYGFVVEEDGRAPGPLVAREALGGANGPHCGYAYPVPFGASGPAALASVADRLADALRRKHGYLGPVRCDALVLHDGRVFPLLELNARRSFFTFVDRLHGRLLPGTPGVFRWSFFRSPGRLGFHELVEDILGEELLFDPRRQDGVVVPVFATVTACEDPHAQQHRPPLRRLFVLSLASTAARARVLADSVGERLAAYEG